jgi:hypothetical protein
MVQVIMVLGSKLKSIVVWFISIYKESFISALFLVFQNLIITRFIFFKRIKMKESLVTIISKKLEELTAFMKEPVVGSIGGCLSSRVSNNYHLDLGHKHWVPCGEQFTILEFVEL